MRYVVIIIIIINVYGVIGINRFEEEFECLSVCSPSSACYDCDWPESCNIGEDITITCRTHKDCNGQHSFHKKTKCLYCWQLEHYEYTCNNAMNCTDTTTTKWYTTLCYANKDVVCMGRRKFFKNRKCSYSCVYSWSRTLFLSITMGGFGIDRFYLGLWKSAIGKLFSFGGLGVWTLVDVILVAFGYIKPHDDSIYC